jgi:hypothetical protein
MTPWIDRLWQLAQHVLLVVQPASSSIVDAYAAIKQSHSERTAGKLQLVVTRCDAGADAARIHSGLNATCERFLGQSLKPPAVLPTQTSDDASFHRSVRLLAAERINLTLRCVADWIATRDDEIGAEKALGLLVDSALEILAEGSNRNQGRDTEHDGKRKQHEPPSRRPRIPPRHFEDEIHERCPRTTRMNANKSKIAMNRLLSR